MIDFVAILALGFFLGMRHATDSDHVVAVSAIVSRERSLKAAVPTGILWGLGHTVTVLGVGGAIILFEIVIPPYVGLGMEMSVGIMLILLGGLNVLSVLKELSTDGQSSDGRGTHSHALAMPEGYRAKVSMRPFVVGIVHGLAGSAAVALLVLGAIRDTVWALGYLLVFGVGTIAGMLLITMAMAMSIAAAARRFQRLHRTLGTLTGLASIVFGVALVYEIGFVHGLFSEHTLPYAK